MKLYKLHDGAFLFNIYHLQFNFVAIVMTRSRGIIQEIVS